MVTPMSMFDIADAFKEPGCPVCRLVQAKTKQFLHSMLFERIIQPETHERFRVGRGLCNSHAWQLAEFKGALLNISIYYRGAINDMLKELDAAPVATAKSGLARLMGGSAGSPLADVMMPNGPCIACDTRKKNEQLYVKTVGEYISDARLSDPYRASDGLCLPHFRQSMRFAKRPADQKLLLEIQRAIWEALIADLDLFKEMHDHKKVGQWMGDEGDSWLRALRGMAGEEDVFGIDDILDE